MIYAIIENNTVVNIATSEYALNENWIFTNDVPVCIGDTYDGESFYRNGEKVISEKEYLYAQLADMKAALELLGVTLDE